jgi:hypothetical protein
MQDLIEELIRCIGNVALRLVTFGRYRGGYKNDRLHEGAIGFAILAAVAYATYSLGAR